MRSTALSADSSAAGPYERKEAHVVDTKLEVRQMDVESLVPYAGNAKVHTPEQISQIASSIEEFGFNDPVAIWGTEIVEVHGRILAAKKLGIETVPVIRLDHMTDEQRRAYTHVHNQLTMNTGFDEATLAAELDELDFDFSMLGFDVESPNEDDFGTDFTLDDSDEPQFKTMTLSLDAAQFDLIEQVVDRIGDVGGEGNYNGNAIAEVCRQWQALRN